MHVIDSLLLLLAHSFHKNGNKPRNLFAWNIKLNMIDAVHGQII
jgi:hypothetical protein